MDRDGEHVALLPEDRLGPVPVVGIDIDDGDPAAGRRQGTCCDRSVVDEAIAAVRLGPGVMTGRPAQRIRGSLAFHDHLRGGRSARCRSQRSPPGPLQDRVDVVGEAAHLRQHGHRFPPWRTRQRTNVGHCLRIGGALRHRSPPGMGTLEKIEVPRRVHGEQLISRDRRRRLRPKAACRFEAAHDPLGSFGHLSGRQHRPTDTMGFGRIMQPVIRMGEDDHRPFLSPGIATRCRRRTQRRFPAFQWRAPAGPEYGLSLTA